MTTKHRMHGYHCSVCGGATSRRNRQKVKLNICATCKENVDALPDYLRCKGTTGRGTRCRQVVHDDYCYNHKHQAKGDKDAET